MTKRRGFSEVLRVTIANVLPLALMWITGFVLMRISERFGAPASLKEVGTLSAIVIGAGLAWKLQGRIALFLLAIFFAEVGSLAIAHAYYSVDRVNGGPVQMTILIASVLGVIVGTVTNRRRIVATA
jgi:hypothetical protein